MKRRMTVITLRSGGTVIHSAIRMNEPDLAALEKLGRPRLIVVPNLFHDSEAGWYAERYPEATVLAPQALTGKLAKKMRLTGSIEQAWPTELRGELDAMALAGTRVHEAVLHHAPSRTLVLTDLVFNFAEGDLRGLNRLFMSWNGAVGRFGPSRIFRSLFVADRRAFGESMKAVLSWDFDRVILSHGRCVESGAKGLMRSAFSAYTGGT